MLETIGNTVAISFSGTAVTTQLIDSAEIEKVTPSEFSLYSDQDCFVRQGSAAMSAADSGDFLLKANTYVTITVYSPDNHTLSVIGNGAEGTLLVCRKTSTRPGVNETGVDSYAPLLELDFSTPVTQSLPATPEALASAMGTTKTADRVLLFAGTDGVEDSAGGTWNKNANILTQRKAVGLYNGDSMAPQIAYESDPDGGVSPLLAASSTIGDSDTESVAVLIVFRATKRTGNSVLFGKRDPSPPNRGWEVYLDSNGKLWIFCDDDDTNASNGGAIANHDDGAWHYAVGYINNTLSVCGAFSDLGTSSPGSISSLTTLTNSISMGFLGQRISAGPGLQIAYAAIFTGSNAEGLTSAIVENWWKLGSDPTGKLTTYTRANGTIADVVNSNGDVATYSGYSTAAQIAYGWRNELGVVCANAITNNIVDSVDLANATYWASVGSPTVTHLAADGPDGLRSATKIASDNGSYYRVAAVPAAAGSVTVSWWARGDSAHNARLVIANASAVVKDTYDYAVTTSWQRFSRTFTYDGSTANIQIRWHGSDSSTAQTVYVWGPQSVNSSHKQNYCPNKGSVVACPGIAILADLGAGNAAAVASKGELQVRAQLDYSGSSGNRYLGWLREHASTITGSNDNGRILYVSTTDKVVGFFYNANGSLSHVIVEILGITPTDVITYIEQWDNTKTIDGTNYSRVWDGTAWRGSTTLFTSDSDPLTRLYVGSSLGALSAQGVIYSVKTYAKPQS